MRTQKSVFLPLLAGSSWGAGNTFCWHCLVDKKKKEKLMVGVLLDNVWCCCWWW